MRIKLLVAIPLLLPLIFQPKTQAQTVSGVPQNTIKSFFVDKPQSNFPDMGTNYIKTVVEPKQAAEKAEAERVAAEQAAQAALYVPVVTYAPHVYYAPQTSSGSLTGSIGYAISGGNCINQVPVNLRGEGNPINWPVTTMSPYIGGAALWAGVNHVARITGFWSNGDIEVAQENWSGPVITRFSRSTFRGYR